MSKKLTLSIDENIIERAKKFARLSNRSLSEIIESYLTKITDNQVGDVDTELSDLIGIIKLPKDFDEKKEIRDILTSKHL